MSEWVRRRLGEVADTLLGKTLPRGSGQDDDGLPYLRNVNVQWGRVSLTNLNRMPFSCAEQEKYALKTGDLLVCEGGEVGRCALLLEDLPGIFFQNALHRVRVLDQRVLTPQYLVLWLEHHVAQGGLAGLTSQVTIAHLNQAKLRSLPVAVPELREQRRIVAVMAAIDAEVKALRQQLLAAKKALTRLLQSGFSRPGGVPCAIVDLCTSVVGGTWGSPPGESEIDLLALGPRVYSFGTSGLSTTGSPFRSVTRKQASTRIVQAGDIILERSGGSPEQPVGRVVIAGEGLEPCMPTDFQRLLRPDVTKVDPRFLYWRLQADWNAGLSRLYSRRTTGLTNLSVMDYLAREIPVPDFAHQRQLVGQADAFETVLQTLGQEATALGGLRSRFLTALLSQQITLSEGVDQFVPGAV